MKQTHRFSIVMPVFNASNTIDRAIFSVLSQTLTNWNLIVINDFSTDDTEEIIAKYLSDNRITYLKLCENKGVSEARNVGISCCKGEIISFLDADDWWHPKKLEKQDLLFRSGALVVYSPYISIKEGKRDKIINVKTSVTYKDFYFYNPIPNLTGSFNRKLLPVAQKKIGHEDYVMWWEIINKAGSAVSTKKDFPLAYYSVGNHSLSANKLKSAKWHWVILTKIFGLGLIHASYYFSFYLIRSIIKRL